MPRARCSDELSAIHSTATRKDDRPPTPLPTMDSDEYRRKGKEMVDYIADYLDNIRERRVFPDVKPGYMRGLVPDAAPSHPEPWDNIFNDIEKVIMPGASSPACTELEMIVMDWLGKMIGLPDQFFHSTKNSPGGGVIQTTASEATFTCLLAARTEAIQRYQKEYPDLEDAEINSRLVAYCSDQAHSSVEKAGLIGLVKLRYIESDNNLSMRGDNLLHAIHDDRGKGLIPFFILTWNLFLLESNINLERSGTQD